MVATVTGAAGPVALVGGEAYGVPFVLEALARTRRVAWLDVPEHVRDDVVAQGNVLARAINRTATAPLLGHALPYRAHLQTLRHYRHELQPLELALSGAARAPALAADLVHLSEVGYGVVLDLDPEVEPPPPPPDGVRVLGPEVLRLTPAEAAELAPGGVPATERARAYADTEGRYLDFLRRIHGSMGLPRVYVPSPDGPRLARPDREVVDARLALEALRRQQRWLEALDLAVRSVPDQVDAVLASAGPAYQEAGTLSRLHLLLSALPDPYRTQERVLEWRLMAAVAVGDLPSVAPEVDAHLAVYEAPELRARRAGTLTQLEGFPLAREAVAALRTPLTLWQAGRMHPDPVEAVTLLRQSVELAEAHGSAYAVARNAGTLAARLLYLGDFRQARAWADWALHTFDAAGLLDGRRRLQLLNDLAASRILTGDLAGLRPVLEGAQVSIEGVLPVTAGDLRATLSWFELASGDAVAALGDARAAYDVAPRARKSWFAVPLVRALNEAGASAEALRVAEEATALSGEDIAYRRLPGRLARGMARAVAGAEGAEADLIEVMGDRHAVPAEQRLAAALHFLLASGGAAQRIPEELAEALTELHPRAVAVLSGPDHVFEAVWGALGGRVARVRLRFLGRTEALVEGSPVRLPPRLAEIALALALHPEGIGVEALHAYLVADDGAGPVVATLYAHIKRLRALLPVDGPPYRLRQAADVDVVRLRHHLDRDEVRDAVTLYAGPLLPESAAPGVREHAAEVEERLRQAVLAAADPDAAFQLAEVLQDDLEVWEAAEAVLPPGDPRLALARARSRRLREEYTGRPDTNAPRGVPPESG